MPPTIASFPGLRAGLPAVRSTVASGYRWWIGELAAIVPVRLARPKRAVGLLLTFDKNLTLHDTRHAKAIEITVDPSEVPAHGFPASLSGSRSEPRRCNVLVAKRFVHLFRTSLPLAAERELTSVLEHEVQRLLPVTSSQVHYAFRTIARDAEAGRLNVEIAAIKREAIKRLCTVADRLGLRLESVELADDTGEPPFQFIQFVRRAGGRSAARRGIHILDGVAVFLSLCAISLAFHQHGQLAAGIAAEIEQTKSIAEEAAKLQRQLTQAREERRIFSAADDRPSPRAVLAELTRLLPDDTWIFDLSFSQQEVRLRGYSHAALELVPLLEGSPLFSKVRFRSPTTEAPGGRGERFDLSIDLKSGAPS